MCDYDDSKAYLEQARKRDRLFVLLRIFLVCVALAYMAAMGIAVTDVVHFLFK